MADEWYQFVSPDHFWMRWRHGGILRAVRSSGVELERGLEIGCGSGVARNMLEEDLDIPVDGCDLNRAGLEMAQPGRGQLFFYDILEFEPSMLGKYDVVFLLDVLEHIRDDAAFLVAALRHLRPGGMVVVNVPAGMFLFSQYDRVTGHVRRYSRQTLADLFHRSQIELRGLTHWGFSMVPVLLARKIYLTMIPPSETMRVGFAPPNKFVQSLFEGLKDIEMALPTGVPFGTSLLAWGTRSETANV